MFQNLTKIFIMIVLGICFSIVCSATEPLQTLTLKWEAPLNDQNVAGYRIYYGTSNDKHKKSIDVGNSLQHVMAIDNFVECETYYFRVRAYDAENNEGTDSNEQIHKMACTEDVTPPMELQDVTGEVIDGNIKLSWPVSLDTDVQYYFVYYGTSSREYGLPIQTGLKNNYTFEELQSGKKYYFTVSVVDTSYNESGFSNEVALALPTNPLDRAPSGVQITGLSTASGKFYEIQEGLSEGSVAYIDRTYTYLKVPTNLINSYFIKTGNADSELDSEDIVEFTVNSDIELFIAHDDRITIKPDWLKSFEDTDENLITYKTMSVYKKDFSAGTIALGPNGSGGSMYTIILKEKIGGIEPEIDTEPPNVEITEPTKTNTFETNINSVELKGTADDNEDLSKVTWSNSRGGEGVAKGTEIWSISDIELFEGQNIITITAEDASGNTNQKNLTVNYAIVSEFQISDLIEASEKNYEVIEGLKDGSISYIDRTYDYKEVPQTLLDAYFIKTANSGDKDIDSENLISFTVNKKVSIYIAHDDRISAKPSWLSSFSDTGENLITYKTMSLFQKEFDPGDVVLGKNGSGGSMYTVIVVPL